MQSLIFVFAGLQKRKTEDLLVLKERLEKLFSDQQLPIRFTQKDKLLISRYDGVGLYVSIFNDEQDVKDWYQMAKDFELTANPNPISSDDFSKRLAHKKLLAPDLYKNIHYQVGMTIFQEMDNLNDTEVFFFL